MTDVPPDPTAPAPRSVGRKLVAKRREDRRKAALKANMARRKTQLRGRNDADPQLEFETDAGSHADPDPNTKNE